MELLPFSPPHLEGEIIFSTHDDGKCGELEDFEKIRICCLRKKIFGGEAEEGEERNTRALFSIPRPQKDLLLPPPTDFFLEMSVCAYALSRIYALLLGKIFFKKSFYFLRGGIWGTAAL